MRIGCLSNMLAGKGHKAFLFTLMLLTGVTALAQPGNDNCTNASPIIISNNGYGFGVFTSAQYDITAATVQPGETFAPAILVASQTQKSVWYKFSLPTNRSVRVTLAQPPASAITAGDAGFAIYKSNVCLPNNDSLSTKLTPIALFGSTYHPCVEPGEYLVQVSAKSNANGPVFIELSILDSSGALYDHPTNAYQFGTLSAGPYVRSIDYDVECQSLEDGNEACPIIGSAADYTKSTWHTFKTPAYFDYISILLASPVGNFYSTPKIGYRLYKGNARTTPVSALTIVRDCDSFKTTGFYPDRKTFRCGDLDTGTTYSIQLFFHKDFFKAIRFAVAYDGNAPTQAPQPILSTVPASNKLGVLPSNANGVITYANDQLGCNSLHAGHPCPPSLPGQGILYNGIYYNLSTFFTFTLATTSRLDIRADANYPSCYTPMLMRLYNQDVSNNCASLDSAHLVAQFMSNSNFSINCMPPGNYTVQVSGTDTAAPLTNIHYGYLNNNGSPLCLFNNLSQRLQLRINTVEVKNINKFSLNLPGAVDSINAGGGLIQPLQLGTSYSAKVDTFGCSQTLLPDTVCGGTTYQKAMYREFKIADSGFVNIIANGYYSYIKYMLLKGSASTLAAAQNINSYPDRITGLTRYSECRDNFYNYCYGGDRVCVVPGDYTFVSFGGDNIIGITDKPSIALYPLTTIHYSPLLAQNLGSIIDSVGPNGGNITTDADYFSCKDNADTINGYVPCSISGHPATKAIYRQFYLNAPAVVQINGLYPLCPYTNSYGGLMTLFYGKATDGLSGLTPVADRWKCFQNQSVPDICTPLPAGWYTVVSYGGGPSYSNPIRDVNNGPVGYSNYVSLKDQFTITVTKACPGPKYNRPYKAAVDSVTHQPYLIQWIPRVGHTAAFPNTDTTYTLYKEDFNCTVDTPFSSHPITACATGMNKVAYYVFKTTQESYIQIDTKGFWAKVYDKDVRIDSARFDTLAPIQPCIQTAGYIQLCRLQPGTYTLAIFAANSTSCTNVQPTIYVARIGYSRFDHAINAYDFGTVPPDSAWHKGKVGDVNPIDTARAPSNDFIYCTTGAQPNEPTGSSCGTIYNPNIYNPGVNNPMYTANTNGSDISRRTLWYTFVTDQGGYVHVKVDNKTLGNGYVLRFAVYKSNVNGTLPFSTVVSTGQVDSTAAQGLTFIATNPQTYYYCANILNEITFYRDPCSATPERYYIVVENTNSYPYEIPGMKPNSQAEVSILIDSVKAIAPLFDHYSQAYNFGAVGPGTYTGATDNFSCATRDATDPLYAGLYNCSKNLWYKFTTTVTGHVRSRMMVGNSNGYNYDDIQLFRQIVPGDSTSTGLQFQGYSHQYDSGYYWTESCIFPGTYYLLLPGCNRLNEYVFPQIKIIQAAGDFCSAPVLAPLSGPGNNTATVSVDCHTIGTDYGEFNPLLTCPANTPRDTYKSSWFRIDITGTDTLDVTAYLNESTTASSAQIKYRMMTGNCGAMQEQSCVQDALTQNTYKCLVPGSYYLQVFTPVSATGTIDLKLSAIKHADTCAPVNNCLANANFIPQFDCTTGDSVRFVNYSTYGSAIQYTWNFGYNGQTSAAVSPSFFYPALPAAQTYTVTLNTSNTSCIGQNNATAQITIPGRPYVDLGKDTALCNGGSLVLNATSHPGSRYQWSTGDTTPVITVSSMGVNTYWVKVTYNNCIKRDTIKLFINPIVGRRQGKVLCGNDSIQLSSYRGYGETYLWSTGATGNTIYASIPGTYYCDVKLNSCIKRDTFNVTGVVYPFTSDSIQACFKPGSPYVLNAATPGAVGYSWQNGSTSPTFNVTTAGLYWVTVNFGSCSVRDSIKVSNLQPQLRTASVSICTNQNYMLPSGTVINAAGVYNDTLRNTIGCDSIVARITVTVQPVVRINSSASICQGQSYTLPWGTTVNAAGTYRDTLRSTIGCDSLIKSVTVSLYTATAASLNATVCAGQSYALPSGTMVSSSGTYRDTLRYVYGCDSLITTVNLQVKAVAIATQNPVICAGQSYTTPSGRIINTTGTYRDTSRYANGGCDSIRFIINLAVRPLAIANTNAVICAGQFYTMPGGQVINVAGVYKDTLHYQTGSCDSLITTVNLTVKSVNRQTVPAVICGGQSYTLPSGATVSASGTYRDTLHYTSGCDSSITTVNLAVRSATNRTIAATICAGQNYLLPGGAVATASGTYIDTLHYINPVCDSIITRTTLTVKPVIVRSINPSICAGQSYTMPSGTTVNAAGIYHDTLHYTNGCDSLRTTILLSVKAVARLSATASICNGQSFTLPSGTQVSIAGTYPDTLRYVSGCDSIINTITLRVNTATTLSSSATVCQGQGYTFPWGTTATTAGVYRDTLRSSTGCDSIIRAVSVSITPRPAMGINPPVASVCDGDSLQLKAYGGTTYQWIQGNGVLSPTNASTFIYPPSAGLYLVAIYDPICNLTDTFQSMVTIDPLPLISITKSNDVTCMQGSAQLVVTGGSRYIWSPAAGLSNAGIANPFAAPAITTVYYVQAVSNKNCKAEDSVEVKVIKGDAGNGFLVASAFTPDGDGRNDCFSIRSWGAVTDVHLNVYNRYGLLVFTTTDPTRCWDGTYKGEKLAPAAFIYIISANTICGPVNRKGTVVLIR